MIPNRKLEPRVIFRTTNDGAELALVELVNCRGHFATLDRLDWDRWLLTRTGRLFLSDNGHGHQYVKASRDGIRGHVSNVARDLLDPGPRRVVGYHDGDRLNLRRKNLFVQRGYATGQTPVVTLAA